MLAWRHPRPREVVGRCVGRCDVSVDPRKVRRLARRIQRQARRAALPQVVSTSPLKRCHAVGRWLKRRGWIHHVDDALCEMDFGRWEGRTWCDIDEAEVRAWCDDFAHHAPGGGESLQQMLHRVAAWVPPPSGGVVVAHAGWMVCRQWVARHGLHHLPTQATQWPQAPSYGQCWSLR